MCTLLNTACGSERRELREFRERGEPALWVTLWADVVSLCRLHYLGSDDRWGFAVYLYSREAYEDSVLPTGLSAGTPEEALDCACGLYLNDPSAWV